MKLYILLTLILIKGCYKKTDTDIFLINNSDKIIFFFVAIDDYNYSTNNINPIDFPYYYEILPKEKKTIYRFLKGKINPNHLKQKPKLFIYNKKIFSKYSWNEIREKRLELKVIEIDLLQMLREHRKEFIYKEL